MLKTLGSYKFKIQPGEGRVGVGRSSRAGHDGSRSKIDDDKFDGGEVGDDEVGKKVQKLSKFKKMVGSDFLTLGAKLAFTKLRQAFVKALIFHHFNLERHIQIETDAIGYAIGGIFSQLTLKDLGQ